MVFAPPNPVVFSIKIQCLENIVHDSRLRDVGCFFRQTLLVLDSFFFIAIVARGCTTHVTVGPTLLFGLVSKTKETVN